MMKGTIEYRDGWMCVKTVDTNFNEPVQVTQYWPICRASAYDIQLCDLTGCEAEFDHNGNVYYKMGHSTSAIWSRNQCLYDGSKTVCIATDSAPLPCPKVRKGVETRYRNGRWEKCLRTGWTAA